MLLGKVWKVNAVSAVIRSVEIQASPSVVWRWLATPDALRQWLGPKLDIDLRVGGADRLCGPNDDTWITGTVLDLAPEDRMILSWLEEGGDWFRPARLSITLTPIPTGTRVSLIHDGFEDIGKAGWQDTVQAYERGVDEHRLLERLAALVVADRATDAA